VYGFAVFGLWGKYRGSKGVVYGFAVFGLWEKCRGFGFLCMGCLAKRLGRKRGRRVLCMGLQCLVYGKNVGVLVFYVWVAWRRGWEGNGAEGCLRLKERMVIICCDSNNGERMEFAVFVYGSVFGFWEKFWVCCG
jgi:hypothetical protein